jgi:hypothetical protein
MQAIIMHKWHSHARRHLTVDITLYTIQMGFFIADLSIVGLTLGRSFLVLSRRRVAVGAATATSALDASATGLACTVLELCTGCICVRNLWRAPACSAAAACTCCCELASVSDITVSLCCGHGAGAVMKLHQQCFQLPG